MNPKEEIDFDFNKEFNKKKQEEITDFEMKSGFNCLEEYIENAKNRILDIPSSEYNRSITIMDFPPSLDTLSFDLCEEFRVPLSRIPDLILSWGTIRIEKRIENKLIKKRELLESIKKYVQIVWQTDSVLCDFYPVFGSRYKAKRIVKIRESTFNKISILRKSLFAQSSNLSLTSYLASLVDSEVSSKINWFGEIKPQIDAIICKSIDKRNDFYLSIFKHVQNDLVIAYFDENNGKSLTAEDLDVIVSALRQFRKFKIKSVNIDYVRLKLHKEKMEKEDAEKTSSDTDFL